MEHLTAALNIERRVVKLTLDKVAGRATTESEQEFLKGLFLTITHHQLQLVEHQEWLERMERLWPEADRSKPIRVEGAK